MRPPVLAAVLLSAFSVATPAAAQSVDQFNNLVPPSLTYEDPSRQEYYRTSTSLSRLHEICQRRTIAERQACSQAWREINAAYAELQARKAAAPALR